MPVPFAGSCSPVARGPYSHLGGLGLRRGIATAPARRRLAHPVEMAVRQPRQALVTAHRRRPRIDAASPAEWSVHTTRPASRRPRRTTGWQPQCNPARMGVSHRSADPECAQPSGTDRSPARSAPVTSPWPSPQSDARPPLVRLGQLSVAQPPQGPRHGVVRPPPVSEVKVHRLTAGHEFANLVNGPQSFDVQFQDHPSMIPKPPPSGSPLVGFAPTVQVRVSWDNTHSAFSNPEMSLTIRESRP